MGHGHPLHRARVGEHVDRAPVGEPRHGQVRDLVERRLVVVQGREFGAGLREELEVRFRLLARRDVHAHAGDAPGLATVVGEDPAPAFQPVEARVGPLNAVLHPLLALALERAAQCARDPLPVLRDDEAVVIGHRQGPGVGRQPVERMHAGPPRDLVRLQVRLPDGHAAGFDGKLQARLAGHQHVIEFLQAGLGQALLRAIPQDLHVPGDRAALVPQRHELAGRPEPLAALALVPALVGCAAPVPCGLHFALHRPGVHVLGREEAVHGLASHFLLGPPQHAMRALVPAQDAPLQVGPDDRVVDRALDDLPVMAFGDGRTGGSTCCMAVGLRFSLARSECFR